MNPQLQALITLQEIDLKITNLNKKNSEIPSQKASLQQALEAHERELNKAKDNLANIQKERKRLEGEVELLRSRRSKYKDQLMEVKTNKEYQAMLKEIEACEEEIAKKEDKILEGMLNEDDARREVKAKEEKLQQEREMVAQKQRELDELRSAIDEEIERLCQKKQALEATIDQQLLSLYKRVASVRRGIALAEARDESCQVCHVRLRPQVYSDIKKNDQIITCESCDRILYYRGELPQQAASK